MEIKNNEQVIELGQVSVLTLGIYGPFLEGARTFDYYPYES